MVGMTVDQVRAMDVADLAACLLGLGDAELLGVDAGCAEAVVVAAARVIGAVSAVQAVAIEAWGRREGEQLRVDTARWRDPAAVVGSGVPGADGANGARLRLMDGIPKDEHDFMPSYLGPTLRLSPRSARRRYESARVLVGCLPRTLAALRAGDLEPHRAQQVVDEVPTNNPGVCAAVEAALFPRIVDKPTSRVGMLARKAVAAADPAAAVEKAKQADKGRFVFVAPSGLPGLMRLEAELDSGKGRLVWAAIEELAADYLRDEVAATVDQARADALVDLVLANVQVTTVVDLALPAGFASDQRGGCGRGSVLEERATGVLVDADQGGRPEFERDAKRDANRDVEPAPHSGASRRKKREAADPGPDRGGGRGRGRDSDADRIGDLVRDRGRKRDDDKDVDRDPDRRSVLRLLTGLPTGGVLDHRVGTLTPATIEAILANPDTVFRRLVIDPETGWLMDAGATTYQPGRHLARTVRKRDLHCRFPGCWTAARFCDLDHVIPFPLGPTVLHNLACLCRRHHRLKTHGHWSLTMTPDGICTWTDRNTGQVHTTDPADYRELAV